MALVAVLLALAIAPLGPVSKQNSTADKVAALSLELGIRFSGEDPKDEIAADRGTENSGRSALGVWVDEETERADDSISALPAPAQEYLRAHRDVIERIVSALEKGAPDWGADPKEESTDGSVSTGRLLPTIRLGRVLMGTALSEERAGQEFEAERALDASWSLARSIPADTMLGQLMRVAFERWQAGVLRKTRTPSLVWMGRLGTGDPYRSMIDAVDGERWSDPTGLADRHFEAMQKARTAMFDSVRRMSPCEFSVTNEEDIKRMTSSALGSLSFEDRQIAEILSGIALPNLVSAVRRAGRLSVDRELTLQILRLRLARASSRDERWPAELTDRWSDVCPGVSYVYRTDGISMDIHFDAWLESETLRALPLSFHSGKTRLLPTPTRPPTPTPTPAPEDLDSDEPEQDDGASMSSHRLNGNWWREATR